MDNIDLSDYIAGGYYLVKPAARQNWQSQNLLPEKLISLSRCICPIFEVFWGMIPGDRESTVKFGMPENLFNGFRSYTDYDEGYPYAFGRIETLRKFISRFLTALSDDSLLLGTGLHRDRIKQYWSEDDIKKYGAEEIGKIVELDLPLAPGGQPLGFDVVGQEFGMSCSWLCSSLEHDMYQLFGIRTNERGLINVYIEAKQICDWIEEADSGTRAEPIPYDPWLLVSYPLTGSL